MFVYIKNFVDVHKRVKGLFHKLAFLVTSFSSSIAIYNNKSQRDCLVASARLSISNHSYTITNLRFVKNSQKDLSRTWTSMTLDLLISREGFTIFRITSNFLHLSFYTKPFKLYMLPQLDIFLYSLYCLPSIHSTTAQQWYSL